MKKYLLIDGNNLAIRASFGNAELENKDGVPTGVHYGVFQSLVSIRSKFPDYKLLIGWDGKSARRVNEAKKGVEDNLIPSGYKENRPSTDLPKPLQDFYDQSDFLKKAIGKTGIPQIRIPDMETDDVLASYCTKLKEDSDIIILTSDEDYYQLLDDNVSIYNGQKDLFITKNKWSQEQEMEPWQHVHCGALSGDTGDNIHGIPSWGPTTASKQIKKHGTWEAVLKDANNKHEEYREDFPDLDESNIQELIDVQTPKGGQKYPQVRAGMPYTGVALAVEQKKIKAKIPKSTLMLLMFQDRLPLAFSLKKMDDFLDVPDIEYGETDRDALLEYFAYYDMYTLKDEVDILLPLEVCST